MILDEILNHVRASVARHKLAHPEEHLHRALALARPTLSLAGALRVPGLAIIAEVKRASPSRGALNMSLEPGKLACTYAQAGADALSVLTEEDHFWGTLEDLAQVRQALDEADLARPILRKDFIVDPYQLLEARVKGADAVLLIVAALDATLLGRLYQEACELGLTPLVEVHNERELDIALALNPPVVGINNRNLADMSVSLDTTRRLRPRVPDGCLVVSESGIHDPHQIAELAALHVDAALIGEALVTSADPAHALTLLKEAAQR